MTGSMYFSRTELKSETITFQIGWAREMIRITITKITVQLTCTIIGDSAMSIKRRNDEFKTTIKKTQIPDSLIMDE
jgi:hypothetical protein